MPTTVGTISPTGLYTAPAMYQSSYVYIYARSGSMYSQTEVHLSQGAVSSAGTAQAVGISVSPASIYLYGGQSAQFSAAVSGSTNTQVMWSISQGLGSIVNGLYTAPSSVSSDSLVTILATSMADPTKSASATILLGPAITPAVTTPPPSTVSISLRPRAPSLKAGQSKQFTATVSGSSNTAVTWSLNPNIGTVSNGLYTAPTTISATQIIQITATSVGDTTQSATSNMTLSASASVAPVTATPSPATTVSPSTLTVAPGGTGQFSVQNLPSGVTVAWGVSPPVGSIPQSGLYTAPSSVAAQQILTVTATNSSTQAVLGTASLTLTATPPPPSVSPATVTVAPSGTQQFTVQNLPSGTTVAWSVSPTMGSIASNGLYNAPSTVATRTIITVTAKNSSTSAVLGTASLTLTATPQAPEVSPATATVAPLGSQVFSVQNLPSGTTVAWSISPGTGIINGAGVYEAPGNVASQQTITVTAKNGSTNAVLGTASLTLLASPPAVTNIVLPVEVMGASSATASVSFTIPSGNVSGPLQLWLQIHGLEYQTQASVQVNSGAWIPINDSTATYLGNGATFGGIGGGFATLQLTLNLPSGSITPGQNTITFRFNATDGISSGFRVLNLNVLASNGSQLIPASTFTQDDPSTWTPPLNDAADIQAGQTLWQTANLTAPGFGAIRAKCGSCHTQDGRDLKYFNYSNVSIQTRAMFHGLTAQQGNQIASYIRSLNAPASSYGRPWNPPYQPGPGIDSRAVSDWAAGAGLDAVLDNDADTLAYVLPGGNTANIAGNAYLDQREIPIFLQLRDWNHWLPIVHPIDAFGAQFTSNPLYTMYGQVRGELIPNDPTTYKAHYSDLVTWVTNQRTSFLPLVIQAKSSPVWNNLQYGREIYSVALWALVKSWEINQEFGLEGMSQVAFGPQAADRAWFSNQPFMTSPFMIGMPRPTPGLGNGSAITTLYDSFIWYQLQLILNDGNGTAAGTWPIDRQYALNYLVNDLTWDAPMDAPRTGTAGLFMEWFAKVLQSNDPNDSSPYLMSIFPGQVSTWSQVTPSEKVQLMNTWLSTWFTAIQQDSLHQTLALLTGQTTSVAFSSSAPGSFTGDLAYALPILRFEGVDPTLLSQISAWAAGIWPSFSWSTDLNTTCTTINFGQVSCP